jgi:hypothetical protein
MDSLQTEMPHSYIIGLGNWIRQFSLTDANEQALKTDVLSKDIKTLTVNEVTKCTQIRSEIGIENGSKKSPAAGAIMYMNRSIEELSLLQNAFAFNSQKVMCFACGTAGHIVRHCPNRAAVDQWKKDKPDQYERFGRTNIPCKFGHKCTRKNKGCRFSHQSKGSARVVKTEDHVEQLDSEYGVAWYSVSPAPTAAENGIDWDVPLIPSKPRQTSYIAHGDLQDKTHIKWAKSLILDSGANRHMTGNRDILSNIVPFEMNFDTANGTVSCHEKGDISCTLKDVVYNPQVNTTLISVHQYLSTADTPTVFLTTKEGVWKFDPNILTTEQLAKMKPVATTINGTYTIMPSRTQQPKDIKDERDILDSIALRCETTDNCTDR